MLQYDNVFCRFGNNHYLCSTYYHQQIQDMKQRTLLIALLLGMVLGASGQIALSRLTAYNDFRPAIAHLVDGKTLNLPLANIFLKNSSLLYMNNNGTAMEADMRNLTGVDFEGRSYVRIDTVLAYRVDTIGTSALYCAWVIDLKAFRQAVKNNTNITNLDLSFNTMLGYTTVQVGEEETIPVIPLYYYKIDGKYVRVHERHLKRFFNKEQRRRMESVMELKGFSWTDEKYLMQILQVISQGT